MFYVFKIKIFCEIYMRVVLVKYLKLYRSYGEVVRKEKMVYGIDSLKLVFCWY